MVRATFIDKNGLRKGAWSQEEDNKLRAYVETNGIRTWSELPRLTGLRRCGKSCRLRWLNYLRPDIKRGNYTKEESDLICRLHQKYGNKWSAIAAKLPGRTDNEIKNLWNSHLRKREKQKPASLQLKTKPLAAGPVISNKNTIAETEDFSAYSSSSFGILESSSLSQETSPSSDDKFGLGIHREVEDQSSFGDFWSEEFVSDSNRFLGHDMDSSLPLPEDYGVVWPVYMTTYDDFQDFFCFSYSSF